MYHGADMDRCGRVLASITKCLGMSRKQVFHMLDQTSSLSLEILFQVLEIYGFLFVFFFSISYSICAHNYLFQCKQLLKELNQEIHC